MGDGSSGRFGAERIGPDYAVRSGALPRRTAGRAWDWTAAMIERFIETLADTCNVTLAAKAIEHGDTVANSEQPIAEQEYAEARDRIMARIERIWSRNGVKVET